MYVPGTTTLSSTWNDPLLTVLNTNPILLDQGGRAIIWGQPGNSYRQLVTDMNGNLIWDQVTSIPNDQPLAIIPDPVAGDVIYGVGTSWEAENLSTLIGQWEAENLSTLVGQLLPGIQAVNVVVNIAALRSATSTSLTYAPTWVEGYSTVNDGGEGLFQPSSPSADNGGTIIVDASSRTWVRATRLAEPTNVAWFGGISSNTDVTAAIQSAINVGGPIFFPPGFFNISSTLNITNPNTILLGSGKRNTILNWTPTSGTVVSFNGSSLVGCGIKDLTIAPAVNQSSGTLLVLSGMFEFSAQDIYLGSFSAESFSLLSANGTEIFLENIEGGQANGIGISLSGGNDYYLRNCALNLNGTAGTPISVSSLSNGALWITDCTFEQGDFSVFANVSYATLKGVYFDSAQSAVQFSSCAQLHLESCEFANRPGRGATFVGCADFTVSGCMFENNGDTAIEIGANCYNFSIHDNTLADNSIVNSVDGNGIAVDGTCTNFTIHDNIIANIAIGQIQYGILLSADFGLGQAKIVKDNILIGAQTAGIINSLTTTSQLVRDNYPGQAESDFTIDVTTAGPTGSALHGLPGAPQSVHVTPGADWGDGERWWVASVTSTTVTIEMSTTPVGIVPFYVHATLF